jgi:polyhydroxyalkanoate synthase subunit PhaC
MKQTFPSPLPAAADRHTVDRRSTREGKNDTEQLSFETLDWLSRAMTARLTHGVSPHAQYAAWLDWVSHLSRAPGRQLELWLEAVRAAGRLAYFASRFAVDPASPPFASTESDRRFDDPAWGSLPYALWQQGFLAQEDWWRSATREVRGMAPRDAALH